ncbi:leukocyte immunoglobulin-like receptor subfamily B member 4 [Echinops telfairi]|uniref:Leukocyte immunoglobulin-like receptor subfamily B member 4 n=1 Tax=Echinops telfairi TaxID=9371 RepID=A0ABM1VKL0_ECHTE|nr:leukocyte immunoglobulin-like receptor subfamily B member 4 [Echinops telfairi]
MYSGHAGKYQCDYYSSHDWSQPSDPLLLVLTASEDKPSLSAHPGPSVAPGQNVSLQCRSSGWFDTVYWFREDINHPPQLIHSESQTGPFQANFTMSHVTSAHGGTYRCYTSFRKYLLSQPSDPLELVVSGGLQDHHQSEAPKDAAVTDHQPGEEVELDIQLAPFLLDAFWAGGCADLLSSLVPPPVSSPELPLGVVCSPEKEDPQAVTYAQVNHSRTRQGADAPQDTQVTYAELNHSTLRRNRQASSEEAAQDPSVYAELAKH